MLPKLKRQTESLKRKKYVSQRKSLTHSTNGRLSRGKRKNLSSTLEKLEKAMISTQNGRKRMLTKKKRNRTRMTRMRMMFFTLNERTARRRLLTLNSALRT
jgi:hypothetical protein